MQGAVRLHLNVQNPQLQLLMPWYSDAQSSGKMTALLSLMRHVFQFSPSPARRHEGQKKKKTLQVCSYDRVLILSNSLVSSKHKDHRAPFRGTISCMRGTLLQNSAPSEVQLAVDAAGRRWIERWIKPKSFQIVSDLDGSKFWHLRDVFYICIKNIDYLKAYKQSRVHGTKTVSCTTRS